MMKLFSVFAKDMRASFKSFYIYIELVMAGILVAIALFVIPENFDPGFQFFYNVSEELSTEGMVESFKDLGEENVVFVPKQEIQARMEENRNSAAMSLYTEEGKLIIDVTLQGYENQKMRNLISAGLISEMGNTEIQPVEKVVLASNVERLSDRLNILPAMLVMNCAFMGLFIIATYVFMDKEEGSIKAFAVTPAKIWQYLMSKIMVLMVTGLITGLLMTIPIAGGKPHYLSLGLLLLTTNAFGSAVGLFIASFYNNILKAMGALYLVMVIMALGITSYFAPSFSPVAITYLPSNPMLFAFRETLLDQPNLVMVYQNILLFLVLALVFFGLANHRFKKTLTV